MEHKAWYDEENDLLRVKVVGPYSTKDALAMGKFGQELLEGKPYRQLIVDLTASTTMEGRETRKIQNRILEELGITDVAYVGAKAFVRVFAKVMMKLGSLDAATDFFKTDDEALRWLKDQRRS
jgi:hypothetical protein